MNSLKLTGPEREKELLNINLTYQQFFEKREDVKSLSKWGPEDTKKFLEYFDFENGTDKSISTVQAALEKGTLNLHTNKYFGVFNPIPSDIGALGNLLASLYNPQLASTKSAPLPIEIEIFLIKTFGMTAGYSVSEGNFTTGGTEANLTAVLCALNTKFPKFAQNGTQGIVSRPIIYVSAETHHSIQKASKVTGLGLSSVHSISTDEQGKMDSILLEKAIQEDILKGHLPFMVIGTLGSTNAGLIDPLEKIGEIADKHKLWFHVDGAYGAGLLFLESHQALTRGLEKSHSFSFDAHKLPSLPLGSSLFVTRKKGILRKVFSTEDNVYMPSDSEGSNEYQPYRDSIQWSRRFIGLGLFLAMAHEGRAKISSRINSQMVMADLLRHKLSLRGFQLHNKTPLPVVCFSHKNLDRSKIERACKKWGGFLTETKLSHLDFTVLRVSINNPFISESDLSEMITVIEEGMLAEDSDLCYRH